ncbi:MAG: DUF2085 domain-containing protein [Acidobacteria bacterium]|nr:DUF2085 domain-containing protein [Acidobacteriota bacterium]
MRAGNRGLGAAVVVAVPAWAAGLALAPYVSRLSRMAGGLLYVVGSLICHQQPERSFYLAGAQLPVCARCEGLYLGAALGVLAWAAYGRSRTRAWPRRHALALLTVAAVPTIVTVASALTGVGDPPNGWRFALALPLGLAGGLVVGAVVSEHLK